MTHEWEKGKVAHSVGVLCHDRLIDTDAGIVVYIPGFR